MIVSTRVAICALCLHAFRELLDIGMMGSKAVHGSCGVDLYHSIGRREPICQLIPFNHPPSPMGLAALDAVVSASAIRAGLNRPEKMAQLKASRLFCERRERREV